MSRCLEHGSWHRLVPARNVSAERYSSRSDRYHCYDRRALADVHEFGWKASAEACRDRLHDAITGDFGGVFSNSARPIHVALLSDSLGNQVRSAIDGAAAANRQHLSQIHFARGSGFAAEKLRPLNLATMPRHYDGALSVLRGIAWPSSSANEAGGAARPARVILANSGMWYNLLPYCNGTGANLFGLSRNTTCGHHVMGKTIRPDDLELRHDQPLSARPKQFWRLYHQHFGIPPWGWYSWARRLQGTATIGEYEADLATFLDAATAYARNNSASLLWLETTPQHFANHLVRVPTRRNSSSTVAVGAATESKVDSIASLTAGGCQRVPATPIAPDEPPPAELLALCGEQPPASGEATADVDSLQGRGRRLATHYYKHAPSTECRGDWRNHIARRLLRDRGVPVVPLAAALSSRAELHTGGGGDCTHWCEGSEAHLFLAMATLNTISDLVRGDHGA